MKFKSLDIVCHKENGRGIVTGFPHNNLGRYMNHCYIRFDNGLTGYFKESELELFNMAPYLKERAQKQYDAMTDEQKQRAKELSDNDKPWNERTDAEKHNGLLSFLTHDQLQFLAHTLDNRPVDVTAGEFILGVSSRIRSKPKVPTKSTLPTDSADRKNYALFRGCLRYFPAALAGVARTSTNGNNKHNPGEEMYHARSKSQDHGDCVLRHLMDVEDLLAARERGDTSITDQQILDEVNQFAWRALALSQKLHESFGAPMAPGAKE